MIEMDKIIIEKRKQYKDKELNRLLDDLELYYYFNDKFTFKLQEVFESKAMGSVAKMLYCFLVYNGGSFSYTSKTELYDQMGMTHPLILKAIKELQDREFIKHSKANKILMIS